MSSFQACLSIYLAKKIFAKVMMYNCKQKLPVHFNNNDGE